MSTIRVARNAVVSQAWSPGLCETTFDGCRIEDVSVAGAIVSILAAGGVVRMWDAGLGQFQLYSNTLAEVQLDYPGRGGLELIERWHAQATPVSVDVRLWEQQLVMHAGSEAVAGTIPDHVFADACPFN